MKPTTLEAPQALFDLTRHMKRGYTILQRNGKPVAYLFSTEHYDEEDIGYMTDPKFWEMIRERRESDEVIPLEQVEREIAARERAQQRRKSSKRKNVKLSRNKGSN